MSTTRERLGKGSAVRANGKEDVGVERSRGELVVGKSQRESWKLVMKSKYRRDETCRGILRRNVHQGVRYLIA